MKLLKCNRCQEWTPLTTREVRFCSCKAGGGMYNKDGDTVTILGDNVLYGWNNPEIVSLMNGAEIMTIHGPFIYPEDSSKVRRIHGRRKQHA